ncbi:hypothetical protein ANN_03547 [Periplaneta americana]|uniref:RING-type domain-containing protein n=1 Tax=Periplaneta americana TaxID=6978 RepID=A0ABQ8U0F6_PERAM|nr:hypothetical protein ANN_03547 [Periplaneta americana]
MSPGSSTESYPAFAHIGLRENPGKNLNQLTCPDQESNPGHLVSQPDALTVTPQSTLLAKEYFLYCRVCISENLKLGLSIFNPRSYTNIQDSQISHSNVEMDSNEENDLGLFGDGFGGTSPGPLEESSPSENRDQICNICSEKYCSPRVLSCLHVFCESCLEKMLMDETGDSGKRDSIIKCPKCNQETKQGRNHIIALGTGNISKTVELNALQVGSKGAGSLPCDYVLTNILDMSAIESMAVLCTSCKAKEKAVARCSDCANFLCPNCNTAHQVSALLKASCHCENVNTIMYAKLSMLLTVRLL